MNKPNLKTEIYKRLSDEKKPGDNKIIARKLKLSPAYVCCVCSPRRKEWNDNVISAMLDLLNSRKQSLTEKLKAA